MQKKGFQIIQQTRRIGDLAAPLLFRLEEDRFTSAISKVSLNTEPSQVKIFLDGKEVKGVTPLQLELEVGKTYQLKLQKDGYNSKETTITVDVPGALEKTVYLTAVKKEKALVAPPKVSMPTKLGKPDNKIVKPGSLSITSNPWSYVTLDGNKIGETPLIGFSTSPGKHKLKIFNPEFNMPEKEIIVDIQPNKHLRCTYDQGKDNLQCF